MLRQAKMTDIVFGKTRMLTLGIFGEYLWRILVQAQHRAPYIVEQVFRDSDTR